MAIKILQIDLQNDITPQIGSYDNAGGVTPNNWISEDGVYSLGPTNVDGRTPYYWFTPTREVTDFDLCWEDYQGRSQTNAQYHLEIGDSAGNVVLSALRANNNYYIGPVNVGVPVYQTWHKILIEVRKASASSSTVTAYVDGKKVATGTSNTLLTSAKIALLGHVPSVGHWQNAGQRVRYVTIYDRSYTSKGINLDGMMTTITALISKLIAKLSTVALTGSYNDLSDKPTISTVNDGTLTIQKNGTNVATFTANQSTAATANITVPTAVSELTNDSGYLTSSSNLDASKLTSGTVDIARLPQGALERLVKVANEAARYALTTADVQLGDTVQQLDTGIMYVVTDTDHLDSAAGYTEYTAGTAASVPWSGVTGKPTFAAVATSGAYSDLTGTPTIPTVNNATLTIQRNGTTLDTFTANASVDKTINISTTDDTKIPLAGTNALAGSIVPDTDNAYDFGNSSHNFKIVYAKEIRHGLSSGSLVLSGGNGTTNGANLVLYGTNRSDGFQGRFDLVAKGSTDYKLTGLPNGTLTWGTKNVAMQEDVIPRSGGAVMTAYTLAKANNNEEFLLCGGTDYNNGSFVSLKGKDHNNGSEFLIGTSGQRMHLKPDGTWMWTGQAVQLISDQRLKQQIAEIDDKLLDAWEDVDLVQFKYNDAVDQKKDKARLHTGYVVQQIDEACKSHNVDISEYGLYCHEVYQEETREVEHEDGTKTIEVVRSANEHYSLRYTEALIVECAYLRKCIKELRNEIEQLKSSK